MQRGKALLAVCLVAILWMQSCSSVTALRTHELQKVGANVSVDTRRQLDSLKLILASVQTENQHSERHLLSEIGELSSRIDDVSEKIGTHQEEMLYRLDLLVNSSSRPIKRVLVDKRQPTATNAPTTTIPDTGAFNSPADSSVDPETQAMYIGARNDFAIGEYKLAYESFKQIFEKSTGDYAENSLYWMALCLTETNQQDKAIVVFNRLVDQFPEGKKSCIVLLKLAELADSTSKKEAQIQLLERLTALPQCHESNEAYRAIGILDQLKK